MESRGGRKGGITPKYHSHVQPNLDYIKTMRQDGASLEEISKKLKISKSSLDTYSRTHPELRKVLDESKEKLLSNLKRALFKRALGFEFVEVTRTRKEKRLKLVDGSEIVKNIDIQIQETKKFIQSDKALLFALTNLDPDNWKHKDKLEIDDIKEYIKFIDIKPDAKPPQLMTPGERLTIEMAKEAKEAEEGEEGEEDRENNDKG